MRSFRLALFLHFTRVWYAFIEKVATVVFGVMFIVLWAFLERFLK